MKNHFSLRVLAGVLALIMLFGLMSVMSVSAASSGSTGEGFVYSIENDEVTIERYTGKETHVLIPTKIDGYSVTTIGERAFANTEIIMVSIPGTVKTICDFAFENCYVETVELNEGIKSIGDAAFFGCSIFEVIIPCTVESIGLGAFSFCQDLGYITVADGNPVYDSRNNCNAVIETETNTLVVGGNFTEIPEDVTAIGEYAFSGRYFLTNITIPDSVIVIEKSAFTFCPELGTVVLGDSVKYVGEHAFEDCSIESLTIPEGIKEIGELAFGGSNNLNEVYYLGTRDQWNKVVENIHFTNERLLEVNVQCEYEYADLTGNTITLEGDIGANFFMNLKDEVLADREAKVVFSYDGVVSEIPVSEGEYTEHGYKFNCGLPAKNMSSVVTCQVVTSEGESEEFTFSVKEYAEYIFENSYLYDEITIEMVKAMLNYGAAVQTYFGHNTDNLANDTEYMREEEKEVPEKNFSEYSYTLTEGNGKISYYGTALSLRSEVGMKHYFVIDDSVDLDTLTVTVNGKSAELRKNGNLYEILISDVAAHNLYTKYKVVVGDVSLSYAVMDYAARAEELDNQEILKVMYALDEYAQKATMY